MHIDPESWRERAACAKYDTGLWFPEESAHAAFPRLICSTCPVKQPCLEFAIVNNMQFGIWGGMSIKERRAYNRENKVHYNPNYNTSGRRRISDDWEKFESARVTMGFLDAS